MSKYEKFVMATVNRTEIKGADYNPRIISNQARARLRRGIEENGMVQPLVWNKRTGLLVGGHQRLAILDDLEGGDQYDVQVAVVDVDERNEKKLNVLLNNDSAMGHWDERRLLDIFNTGDDVSPDYEAFGFSANQAQYFTNLIEKQELDNAAVVAAMNEAVEFETEVQISADENVEERHAAKLERKRSFEEQVSSLLVPQNSEAWKLKTDEEKKAYDSARNNYRQETFEYVALKIVFTDLAARTAFLARYNLPPHLETIHESEFTSTRADEAEIGE